MRLEKDNKTVVIKIVVMIFLEKIMRTQKDKVVILNHHVCDRNGFHWFSRNSCNYQC